MKENIYEYTDEQLLDIMRDYYNNVGFPTQRKFNSSNGLPSYVTYFNRFGSFKSAILMAGIPIPKERERYFNRDKLTDEEMLKLLEHYTTQKLKDNLYLLTNEDIDNIDNMPTSSTYLMRFGGVIKAYKLIGYDYYDFNNSRLEEDMILKLKELAKKLGRTPSSRDITEYSKLGKCYATETYLLHFGSLYETQVKLGLAPTRIGNNKSREDMINDLHTLSHEIERLPCHRDVHKNYGMASVAKYADEFGSFTEALRVAGFKNIKNSRAIMSPKGNMCFSSYEYDFCRMLEVNNIDFEKDEYYKKYIDGLDRSYQFDFTVYYKGEVFFIEIFGMYDRKKYREIADTKKNLCIENNIKLVDLYPDDFNNRNIGDLLEVLTNKIANIKGR